MRNITKTLLVLVSSLSLSFAAWAGEVTISGTAKASYVISGADDSSGKGIGVSNELAAKASGEMDNGFTWAYHIDLDPGASGALVQDDAGLVIGMNDLGTVAFYDGEGGLGANLAWGVGALGTGSDYGSPMTIEYGGDVDAEANVQYHTPAGLLPFGLQAKVGFVPNIGDTTGGNDFKSTGAVNGTGLGGNQATQYNVSMAPIEGLSIAADYTDRDGDTATAQEFESGAYGATYAMGNFKVGYGFAGYAVPLSNKNGSVSKYETTSYGIEFAVNDAISLSYSEEKSEAFTDVAIAATKASGTKTSVESEIQSIQAAYVVGGATLGVAVQEADNSDYTTGKEEKMTIFSLVMAF
jgi:hypothetical protein